MRNCKELTELVSRACDEPIGFGEKIELKLHLMMCKKCRHFAKNNAVLHQMMQAHQKHLKNEIS